MNYDAWVKMTPEEARRDRYCSRHGEHYSRHEEECPLCAGEEETNA